MKRTDAPKTSKNTTDTNHRNKKVRQQYAPYETPLQSKQATPFILYREEKKICVKCLTVG